MRNLSLPMREPCNFRQSKLVHELFSYTDAGIYKRIQGDTGDTEIYNTRRYKGIHRDTGDTREYRGIQGIQGDTGGYKGIQGNKGDTEDAKGYTEYR